MTEFFGIANKLQGDVYFFGTGNRIPSALHFLIQFEDCPSPEHTAFWLDIDFFV